MTQILIHNDREYAQYLKNGSGRSGIKSIYIVEMSRIYKNIFGGDPLSTIH